MEEAIMSLPVKLTPFYISFGVFLASPSKGAPRHKRQVEEQGAGFTSSRSLWKDLVGDSNLLKNTNFQEFHPFPQLCAGSRKTAEPEAPLPAKLAKAWLSPSSICLSPPASKAQGLQKTQKIEIWKQKRHPAQTTLPLLLSATEFH